MPLNRLLSVVCIAFFFMLFAACGRKVQSSFWVEGSCDSCKVVIETAALAVSHLDSAAWDVSRSMLKVSYDTTRVSLDTIQMALARAGFSTQYFPADEAARQKLPLCCRQPLEQRLPSAPHP